MQFRCTWCATREVAKKVTKWQKRSARTDSATPSGSAAESGTSCLAALRKSGDNDHETLKRRELQANLLAKHGIAEEPATR